jgi:hypothetical protein
LIEDLPAQHVLGENGSDPKPARDAITARHAIQPAAEILG